jgi:hypothetical protein
MEDIGVQVLNIFRYNVLLWKGSTNLDRGAFRQVSKWCLDLHDCAVTGLEGALPLRYGVHLGELARTPWLNMQHDTGHPDARRLQQALVHNRFPKLVSLGLTLDTSTYVLPLNARAALEFVNDAGHFIPPFYGSSEFPLSQRMPYHIIVEWVPENIRLRLKVLEMRMHRGDTVQSLDQAYANYMGPDRDGDLGQQSQVFQDNWRVRAGDAVTLNSWAGVFNDYGNAPDIETFKRFINEVMPQKYTGGLVKLVLPLMKFGAFAWNGDEADAAADVYGELQRGLTSAIDSSPLDITLAYVVDTADYNRFIPLARRGGKSHQRAWGLLCASFLNHPVTETRTHMIKIAFRSLAVPGPFFMGFSLRNSLRKRA